MQELRNENLEISSKCLQLEAEISFLKETLQEKEYCENRLKSSIELEKLKIN